MDKFGTEFDPNIHVGQDKLNKNGAYTKLGGFAKRSKANKPVEVEVQGALKDIPAPKHREKRQKRRRRENHPHGLRMRLEAPQKEGFHRRWANDDDKGRIHQLTVQDDYEIVKDEITGNPVTAKTGGGGRVVLVEIPQEYYDENQADKAKRISDPNDVGKDQYIPEEGKGKVVNDALR